MDQQELNYILNNFACDHLDEFKVWLEKCDCDRLFIYNIVLSLCQQSIDNAKNELDELHKCSRCSELVHPDNIAFTFNYGSEPVNFCNNCIKQVKTVKDEN